jgi:hypothetical protein
MKVQKHKNVLDDYFEIISDRKNIDLEQKRR